MPRQRYRKPRPTDERGYVVRRSVMDDATRPEYIIPVGSTDGVWDMMKRVGRFRSEGWFSLWKGMQVSRSRSRATPTHDDDRSFDFDRV
jgi:mitochondrial fusion and transport protein UGO1